VRLCALLAAHAGSALGVHGMICVHDTPASTESLRDAWVAGAQGGMGASGRLCCTDTVAQRLRCPASPVLFCALFGSFSCGGMLRQSHTVLACSLHNQTLLLKLAP